MQSISLYSQNFIELFKFKVSHFPNLENLIIIRFLLLSLWIAEKTILSSSDSLDFWHGFDNFIFYD